MTTMGCGFIGDAELDALVEGRLEPRRRGEVERHAAACGACALLLADAHAFGEVMQSGVTQEESDAFEARREFLAARLRQEVRRTAPRRGFLKIAGGMAAAAALLVAGLLIVERGGAPRVDLPGGATMVIEPLAFRAPPVVRETGAVALWAQAGEAYAGDDYARAAALFGTLAERETASPDPRLYEGISLLMSDRAAGAVRALDAARQIAEREALPTASIDYYAALALLSTGDRAGARAALERAAAQQGPSAERARALLPLVPATVLAP